MSDVPPPFSTSSRSYVRVGACNVERTDGRLTEHVLVVCNLHVVVCICFNLFVSFSNYMQISGLHVRSCMADSLLRDYKLRDYMYPRWFAISTGICYLPLL